MEKRNKKIEKSKKKSAKYNKGKEVLKNEKHLGGNNARNNNKIIPLDNQKLKSEIEKMKKNIENKSHKKSLSSIKRPKKKSTGLFQEDPYETKPTEPNKEEDFNSFSESSKYNPKEVLKFFKNSN